MKEELERYCKNIIEKIEELKQNTNEKIYKELLDNLLYEKYIKLEKILKEKNSKN